MKILNKNAKRNYKLLEIFEAGIVLTGTETKAIKKGRVDLSRSFGKIIDGEIYLVNANIAVENESENPYRSRKLLLHKKEIVSIMTKIMAKKLTLVPTKMYTRKRLIKLELALARGKRTFEKRESIKKADIRRDIERELRGVKDKDSRI
jgi:SsrA-binding protein